MRFIEPGPAAASDGPFDALIDASYILSVRDETYRRGLLLEHLRPYRFPRLTIHQPPISAAPSPAIWEAHAEVARHALAAGRDRVLILEDDARFTVSPETLARRLSTALSRLPSDWTGLYLGHFPLQAFPIARGLVRARSGLTHAYVADRRLLEWLAASRPRDPMIPRDWFGWSIDSAFALRPHFYALFPMVAFQIPLQPVRRGMNAKAGLGGLFSMRRWRPRLFWHGPRIAEALTLLTAPWSALTLDRALNDRLRRHRDQMEALQARHQVDEDHYFAAHPDVAANGMPALWHYHRYGAAEGRAPNRAVGEAQARAQAAGD